MKDANVRVPLSARWLGGLGAVPFIGLAGAIPMISADKRQMIVHALAAYGATILSFLGGIHWGMAMNAPRTETTENLGTRLTISVIPPLIGWAALIVTDRVGLCILAAAIASMLWVDIRATRMGLAPPWYPNLRIPLTGLVTSALLFGAIV